MGCLMYVVDIRQSFVCNNEPRAGLLSFLAYDDVNCKVISDSTCKGL